MTLVSDIPVFTLAPIAGDVARFVDRRSGLAMSLPGHPSLVEIVAAGRSWRDEPAYEARVELADIPVSLRYRCSEIDAPLRDLRTLAVVHAANRCSKGMASPAFTARREQLAGWNVDAAASALYALRDPATDGDTEEVLLLARGQALATITKRFPRPRLPPIAWALCNSAIAAGLRWDPAALDGPPSPVWPESSFLVPGVHGTLRAARRQDAARLAALAPPPARMAALAGAAQQLLEGNDAATHLITVEERAAIAEYLARRGDPGPLAGVVAELLAEVRTAHDLRGLCIVLLHVAGRQRATFDDEQESRDFGGLAE